MKLVFTNRTLDGGTEEGPSALASDEANAGGADELVTARGAVSNCVRTVLQIRRSKLDGDDVDAPEQPATITPVTSPAITFRRMGPTAFGS
jgi:hypothetical protein